MANPEFFKGVFDTIATDGCIGDPKGIASYAYLRVSSSGQAEEGRSGLPRQILNIHKAASENGFKIPWDMVYADDDSGFTFEDRLELTRLRREIRYSNRKANAVFIEYLDRLSRNSDWHQGYLLDEMKRFKIQPFFWKTFNSRIERAVMGAISQEGMELALQRMAEGNIMKAQSGRVTARTPAYGYQLVDSEGKTGERAKTDTHYGINPKEAPAVKFIFEQVAFEGISLRSLSVEMEKRWPPPKKMSHWEPRLFSIMIRNRVYKGEFIAHKKKEEKVWVADDNGLLDSPGKFVKRRVERPSEEWIIVPVPAIITAELWELTNRVLDKNYQMGRRNAEIPFLLTGLVKCATCRHTYIGGRKRKLGRKGQEYCLCFYRCAARSARTPQVIQEIGCDQSQISCKILDDAVWSILCQTLLNPEILIGVLERQYQGEQNEQLTNQIEYLNAQIREKTTEDEKLYRAYQAEVFDEYEYAGRRKKLKEEHLKLVGELEKLSGRVMTNEQFEDKKQLILAICDRALKNGIAMDAPFEVKQRTLKTIVDKIVLNVNEGWFEIEGVISGKFLLNHYLSLELETGEENVPSNHLGKISKIVSNPAGRDSSL